MRFNLKCTVHILISFICIVACLSNVRAQESISGVQNISELMTAAEKQFDMSNQDAVLLFDSKRVNWLPDGRLVAYVHRIIWINTEIALDNYGDHRIPYDNTHCTFKVVTIRTWRDGQWWETGETGIVETLPRALRKAYDYTDMREMMLLHDGIELPCILEVSYSIEDTEPFRAGAEGLWTFARNEPVVQSRFSFGIPSGQKPNVFATEGVPESKNITDFKQNLDIYLWEMGPLDAIPRPHNDDPSSDVPHIAWSTWNNWEDFGLHFDSLFRNSALIDEPLKMALDSLLVTARTDGEKADFIAEFINKKTRFINYPENYWLALPRSASRVFASAYGHRLDRAILAAALFNDAGITTRPVFIGKNYGNINERTPALARFSGVGVWISANNLKAYYNPANGSISNGNTSLFNRTIWFPGDKDKPEPYLCDANEKSVFDVRIDLAFDDKKDIFTGTGYLYADNKFSPYDRMEGLENEAKKYLESVSSSLIEDAEIIEYNPSKFDHLKVIVGFKLELEKPEPDDLDRIKLIMEEPSGGIADYLPDNVKLYHQKRSSRIYMPCPMNQKVELNLDLKGIDVLYSPANKTIENDAGSFSVTTAKKDDRITVIRKLDLIKTAYHSDDWQNLRELLLENSNENNQTLLLKTGKDKQNNKDIVKK